MVPFAEDRRVLFERFLSQTLALDSLPLETHSNPPLLPAIYVNTNLPCHALSSASPMTMSWQAMVLAYVGYVLLQRPRVTGYLQHG